MGCLSISVGYWYWRSHETQWQTMLFTTLTLSQMAHVLAIRSDRVSLFRLGLFSNKPLLVAVALTTVLQVALLYIPFLQKVFGTEALGGTDFVVAVVLALVVFCAVEFEKRLSLRTVH